MSASVEIEKVARQARDCLRKGETAQAIGLFQQALEVDPDRAEIHEGIAACYFREGRYEQAVEHFRNVGRLKPAEEGAEVNIGAIYNRQGRFRDAVAALRKALQKNRKCSQAYYNLGLAYRGLQQLSMAVSAYREALRLEPEMAEAHQNLGNVYLEMGNHQQAIQHYKKALELRPGFRRAEQGLIEAERAKERAKQAIGPFGRLVGAGQAAAAPAPRMNRQLSDADRLKDRKTVLTLTEEAEEHATQLLQCLRRELEPQLLALFRAATQGEGAPAALEKVYPRFQEAVRNTRQLRAALAQRMGRLQEHEEQLRD